MTTIPFPNVLDRSVGYTTLQFRNNPDILGYRIRVANSLDNAYGAFNGVGGTGTTALFDVARGRTFISKKIRQKRTGISGDITRGQTRATFDPNEYFGLSPEVPPDSDLWFLRVQVTTASTGGYPLGFPGGAFPGTTSIFDESDILVMQNPGFFSVPRPALTLAGTAPDVGAVGGLPAPAESLRFHVPAFADAMVITNLGPGTLFFSVGAGLPMIPISAGSTLSHSSGMKDEITLAGSGSNPQYSVLVSTVTGSR